MLKHLESNEVQRLQQALSAQPAFNVRISALIKAYGAEQTFFNVWHQDYDTVLARLENSFFVYEGKNPDFEEIAFFLKFNPYFQSLMGSSGTIEQVSAYFDGDCESCCFDFLALKKIILLSAGKAILTQLQIFAMFIPLWKKQGAMILQ